MRVPRAIEARLEKIAELADVKATSESRRRGFCEAIALAHGYQETQTTRASLRAASRRDFSSLDAAAARAH